MRSTLPDLFKSDLNAIKFHPQERPRKIGGRFTINLNTHHTLQSSPEKSPRQLKKLESSTGFTRSIYDSNHARSHSIHQLAQALKNQSSYGNNSLHKARKSVNFVNEPTYISTRNQSVSALSKETPTLQQIFIQNTIKNNRMSSRVAEYGFPYETTRSMNNMKIEIEEADSFKNRVETIVKEQMENEKTFVQIIKQTKYINDSMTHFKQAYLQDLQMFDQEFRFMCKDLMKGLSLMRRQTGQQTKINQADTQRVYYQYKDSGAILNLLEGRTNLLRQECIEDEKIELTNSKTYSQDVYMRIYQSQKQNELDKLFRRTKRSGTSQDFRAGTSHSMRAGTGRLSSKNVLVKDRAQTTQLQGRFINGNKKNMNKEDEQELGYDQLHINQDKQNGKISQLMDQLSINTINNFKNRPIFDHQEQVIQDY